MDAAVVRILEFLERNKIRATYKAVADAAEVPHRSLGQLMGHRRQQCSWVVNASNGEPTGYSAAEKHPDLYSTPEVIRSGEDLIKRMKRESRPE